MKGYVRKPYKGFCAIRERIQKSVSIAVNRIKRGGLITENRPYPQRHIIRFFGRLAISQHATESQV